VREVRPPGTAINSFGILRFRLSCRFCELYTFHRSVVL
jgi:hypothetical protein